MARLTNKTQYGYESGEDGMISLCSDKLGALEDIEQELGIDLITLFKALFIEQDFYFLVGDEMHSIRDNYYRVHILMDKSFEISLDNECIGWYLFKDYGKTWALTREELENGK